MPHIRFLAIATALTLALTCLAQQSNTTPNGLGKQQNTLPSMDEQMATLTAKLDLSRNQQARIRPIMQELHNITEKIMHDDNMTREQQLAAVRPHRIEAGKKIRAFLTGEQSKKFDAYLSGPHGEMHGSLTGTAKPRS